MSANQCLIFSLVHRDMKWTPAEENSTSRLSTSFRKLLTDVSDCPCGQSIFELKTIEPVLHVCASVEEKTSLQTTVSKTLSVVSGCSPKTSANMTLSIIFND